jgi:hypothetical protein
MHSYTLKSARGEMPPLLALRHATTKQSISGVKGEVQVIRPFADACVVIDEFFGSRY